MSFETPVAPFDRSEGAMDAARALIVENEALSGNDRVQALAANEFVTEDGRELDPGNFLASMLSYIESQDPGAVTQEDLASAVERNMATHSRPHDTEMRGEGLEIDQARVEEQRSEERSDA